MKIQAKLASSSALSAISCALAVLSPAAAQAQVASRSATSEAAASASSDLSHLEEVVVTAQRRSENLQKVPISITAVNAEVIQQLGITGTTGLQIAAPSLTLNQTGGGATAVTVRGVTGTGTFGDEAPTSVYIDGVYVAGTPGLYFDLNNIERVEVLKGPQGTLFGRNSVGGSIQIITKTPSVDPHVIASAEYGKYSRFAGQFYGTTGITDTIAVDLAVIGSNQGEGWGRNIFTGNDVYKDKQIGVRSKLLWQPDNDTRAVLSAAYSRVELPALQAHAIREGRTNLSGFSNIGFYNVDESLDGTSVSKQKTLSLNARHDFGAVTAVSITGYEKTTSNLTTDVDGSRAIIRALSADPATKSFSQEFQLLSSEPGKFDWLGGVFYFRANQSYDQLSTPQLLTSPTSFATVNSTSLIDSYAVFGQATLEVLPGTKVTGGLRYTLDKRDISGFTGTQSTQTAIPFRKREDDAYTYRAAISHQVTDTILLYASASSGFKSGLYPVSAPLGPAAAPANLYAYEVGFKGDLLDRTLRLNLSGFYNSYKDIQINSRLPDNSGAVLNNAANSTANGVELDFTYLATQALSFRGGFSYLDSKYKSFPNASCFVPAANGGGANVNITCDVTGNRTTYSPELVFTLSANYVINTSLGDLSLVATESHNSGFYFDPDNRVNAIEHDLVNLSAEMQWGDGPWSTQLWVSNALQEEYYSYVLISGNGDLAAVGAPRTYGLTVKVSF